ncbi:hypothetical protein B0T26DRAFT_645268, partial [Lasiosphaeria miniovina]
MNLFRNPVLVEGYPILIRHNANTGLEISLDVMAKLANTRKISLFGGKILIKGFSTILVPTRRHLGFIFWHRVFNTDGSYLSFTDASVKKCLKDYPKDLAVSELEGSRHILGWCSNANNLTGSADANYKIGWSGLMQPRAGCAFEKVSIVGGMFITAEVSCLLGKKDKPIHIRSRDDYIMRLKWIAQKFVVLYDTQERRAWLVDGVSALLHLVRASLKHDQGDPFSSLFLYNESLLQE